MSISGLGARATSSNSPCVPTPGQLVQTPPPSSGMEMRSHVCIKLCKVMPGPGCVHLLLLHDRDPKNNLLNQKWKFSKHYRFVIHFQMIKGFAQEGRCNAVMLQYCIRCMVWTLDVTVYICFLLLFLLHCFASFVSIRLVAQHVPTLWCSTSPVSYGQHYIEHPLTWFFLLEPFSSLLKWFHWYGASWLCTSKWSNHKHGTTWYHDMLSLSAFHGSSSSPRGAASLEAVAAVASLVASLSQQSQGLHASGAYNGDLLRIQADRVSYFIQTYFACAWKRVSIVAISRLCGQLFAHRHPV